LKIDGYTAARIVYDYSKPPMIPVRLVDTRKAESVLGFRAKTTLREGLEKTVSWYRESRARSKK
jgi:GDP-L-fucose synthase